MLRRCQANTVKGRQCKKAAVNGHSFCEIYQHQEQARPTGVEFRASISSSRSSIVSDDGHVLSEERMSSFGLRYSGRTGISGVRLRQSEKGHTLLLREIRNILEGMRLGDQNTALEEHFREFQRDASEFHERTTAANQAIITTLRNLHHEVRQNNRRSMQRRATNENTASSVTQHLGRLHMTTERLRTSIEELDFRDLRQALEDCQRTCQDHRQASERLHRSLIPASGHELAEDRNATDSRLEDCKDLLGELKDMIETLLQQGAIHDVEVLPAQAENTDNVNGPALLDRLKG